MTLNLVKAQKLLGLPKGLSDCAFRFAGKLTTGTDEEGIAIAKHFLSESGYSACLWNPASALKGQEKTHRGVLVKKAPLKETTELTYSTESLTGKANISERIAEMYVDSLE
jgi:hypothetical protein